MVISEDRYLAKWHAQWKQEHDLRMGAIYHSSTSVVAKGLIKLRLFMDEFDPLNTTFNARAAGVFSIVLGSLMFAVGILALVAVRP